MPSADLILDAAGRLANDWRVLAVGWHVVFGTVLVAAITGRRMSTRQAGSLLTTPLLSVGVLAWTTGNPFNGTVFIALFILLVVAARRFASGSVRLASSARAVAGALLVGYGWSYPHFLSAGHWTEYLIAAPLGILPCPTLAALIGCTLWLGLARFRTWAATLAAAGLVYGLIGVFALGVLLDYGLLAGAIALALASRLPSASDARPAAAALAA